MSRTTPARRALTATLLATAVATAAAAPAMAAPTTTASHRQDTRSDNEAYNKSIVEQVLKGVFEEGDPGVVDRYVRTDYIQHNPIAPDGSAALRQAAINMRQFPDARIDIKHIIAQGDLVLVHSNSAQLAGDRGRALFDILRIQDGKIAEHWDVTQPVPATTASGNDMFSTLSKPTTGKPRPRWLTAYNKKLVTKAFDRLLVEKDASAVTRFLAPNFRQHSPTVTDGRQGAQAALTAYFQNHPQLKVEPKRIIAEGDLVAVHSHYIPAPGERGQAVLNLFRVQNGKIVEHWDTVQDVPATSANDNTMF
ncbi:nuclear transport factor 2 family protein [Streptomyces sp. NPDC090493]|uniref:nuclear transport factor 2 family protein n=1 Tax=Streptomyces sp. NPDC090493 TaxID=3365964 RepID=UPI0038135C36